MGILRRFLTLAEHQGASSPGSRVRYQHIILEQAQGLLGAALPQQRSGSQPSGQPWGGAVVRPAGLAEGGWGVIGCTAPLPTFQQNRLKNKNSPAWTLILLVF